MKKSFLIVCSLLLATALLCTSFTQRKTNYAVLDFNNLHSTETANSVTLRKAGNVQFGPSNVSPSGSLGGLIVMTSSFASVLGTMTAGSSGGYFRVYKNSVMFDEIYLAPNENGSLGARCAIDDNVNFTYSDN